MKARTTSPSSRRTRRATRTGCARASSSKRSDAARSGAPDGSVGRPCAEARRAHARLRALTAIVRATAQELDPGRIVALAMAQIGLMVGFEGWILALALPGQGTLMFEKASGRGLSGLRRRTVVLGDGLIGAAAERRQIQSADDGTPRRGGVGGLELPAG